MRVLQSITALTLLALNASAASYCVGPSATGSGSGADWDNVKAWTDTPVRGDTWYLRDGTYASKTLSVAASGTTAITIAHATVASHVTDTGWSPSMTNASEIAGLVISSSYWTIDGVTGAGFSTVPADTNTAHYGIYITADTGGVRFGAAVTNVTLQHMRWFTTTTTPPPNAIFQTDSTVGDKDGLTISYCLFDGFNETLRNGSDPWDNLVFQYNVVLNSEGHQPDGHGNPINAMYRNYPNAHIRYNLFKGGDTAVTGWISGNNSSISQIYVYGNVFDVNVGGYIMAANSGYSISDCRFYQNTVIGFPPISDYPILGRTSGSGNVARNNLIYNCVSSSPYSAIWDGDYDAWFDASATEGAHAYTSTGDPFVNLAGGDYRLLTNTPSGTALTPTYGTDALGNARDSWTRGAFEFNGSAGQNTNPVAQLTASSHNFGYQMVGVSNVFTVGITNVGTNALVGTASVSAPFGVASGASYNLTTGNGQNIVLYYAPAATNIDSGTVAFTGASNAVSVSLSGKAYPLLSGLTFTPEQCLGESPMIVSNGIAWCATTHDTPAGAGRLTIAILATNAGTYYITNRINAPGDGANSLYISFDTEPLEPQNVWDVNPFGDGWTNRPAANRGAGTYLADEFDPKGWPFSANTYHTLYIISREQNTQMGTWTLGAPAAPATTNVPINWGTATLGISTQ